MLSFRPTGCCGIQELTELSSHTQPEEAMRAFCATILGNVRKVAYADRIIGEFNVGLNHMYSFYLFTAAVFEENRGGRPYGHNFAAFITAHRLGSVTTLPARPNFAFHPDHKVQAWLWKPSLKGLKAWYQAELNKEAALLEAKTTKRAAAKADARVAAAEVEHVPQCVELPALNLNF